MTMVNSGVRVYILPWIPQDDMFESALELLDEKAQAAVKRFYRKEDQWRSLLGRHLTMYALRQQGAQGVLRFEKTPRGKPYLVHPVMDPPILFNISHDNGLLALGYVRSPGENPNRIGVDCMKLAIRQDETPRMFVDVISDQLTPGERASLREPMSDAQLVQRAFIIWTIKEAYIKAIGEGMAFDLQQIDCRLSDGAVWIHGVPAMEWEFRLWAVEITEGGLAKERYAVVSCEWVGAGGGVIFEEGLSERITILMMNDLLQCIGLNVTEESSCVQVRVGRLQWIQ